MGEEALLFFVLDCASFFLLRLHTVNREWDAHLLQVKKEDALTERGVKSRVDLPLPRIAVDPFQVPCYNALLSLL